MEGKPSGAERWHKVWAFVPWIAKVCCRSGGKEMWSSILLTLAIVPTVAVLPRPQAQEGHRGLTGLILPRCQVDILWSSDAGL